MVSGRKTNDPVGELGPDAEGEVDFLGGEGDVVVERKDGRSLEVSIWVEAGVDATNIRDHHDRNNGWRKPRRLRPRPQNENFFTEIRRLDVFDQFE